MAQINRIKNRLLVRRANHRHAMLSYGYRETNPSAKRRSYWLAI